MKHPKVEFSPELDAAIRDLDKSPAFVAQCLKFDIGTQVLRALEEEGLSRADLAKRLGKSRQYVTKMLKAETNFTLDSIAALSVALGREFHFTFAQPGASVKLWQVLDGDKKRAGSVTVEATSLPAVEGGAFADGLYGRFAGCDTPQAPAMVEEAV